MHRLIFQTPSRNCPNRSFNGQEVAIISLIGHRRVRRAGGARLRRYIVTPDVELLETPGAVLRAFEALEDELFIEED